MNFVPDWLFPSFDFGALQPPFGASAAYKLVPHPSVPLRLSFDLFLGDLTAENLSAKSNRILLLLELPSVALMPVMVY